MYRTRFVAAGDAAATGAKKDYGRRAQTIEKFVVLKCSLPKEGENEVLVVEQLVVRNFKAMDGGIRSTRNQG